MAETKEEIAVWWRVHENGSFKNLNVTGKDIYSEPDVYYDKNNSAFYDDYAYAKYYLRRYQVLDEQKRSIDIRKWPKYVWNYDPPRKYWYFDRSGRKHKRRKACGPSFHRRTRRAVDQSYIDYEELEDLGLPLPDQKNYAPRKKSVMSSGDVWDFYDRATYGKHSKCWKDQRKVFRQAKGYTHPIVRPMVEE